MIRALACIALALLATAAHGKACDWSFPNENPFKGDKLRAVDRYTDIPAEAREKLKAKIKAREADDIAEIDRDNIVGRRGEYLGLRQMYFGAAQLCDVIVRPAWSTGRVERAPVYTVDGHSIMIPEVCGNVSRVTWAPLGATQAAGRGMRASPQAPAIGAQAMPEPGALLLALIALIAALWFGRRR